MRRCMHAGISILSLPIEQFSTENVNCNECGLLRQNVDRNWTLRVERGGKQSFPTLKAWGTHVSVHAWSLSVSSHVATSGCPVCWECNTSSVQTASVRLL